jgi:hypothetical protein
VHETRTIEIGGTTHLIEAGWQWPVAPAVTVRIDGGELAAVEYLLASASAHWILHWIGTPGSGEPRQLPLIALAGKVPEEVDPDPTLQAAVLDLALDAVTELLLSHPARIEQPDP